MLTANACCHCVCVAIALCECVLTIGSVSTTFRCRAGHRTFFSIYLRLTRSGGFAASHCFQKRYKNIENTHIPFVSQPTWGWPGTGAGLMHPGQPCPALLPRPAAQARFKPDVGQTRWQTRLGQHWWSPSTMKRKSFERDEVSQDHERGPKRGCIFSFCDRQRARPSFLP